jgi:hypothetical protein
MLNANVNLTLTPDQLGRIRHLVEEHDPNLLDLFPSPPNPLDVPLNHDDRIALSELYADIRDHSTDRLFAAASREKYNRWGLALGKLLRTEHRLASRVV